MPTVVSSMTKQRAGSICRCAAAAKYTSGCGLLRGISRLLKMRPSKNPIKSTGLSIISTLSRSDAVRRDLAMDLLLRTQRPIKQIVAEVGFRTRRASCERSKGGRDRRPKSSQAWPETSAPSKLASRGLPG